MTDNLILGIDPGLKNTGWGVITSFKNKESYLSHGVIKTSSKQSLGDRLASIYKGVTKLTEEYQPSYISVEKIFSNTNPESTLKLGKARGIVFLVAAMYKIKITEYSPNSVKKNLIGYGHASKFQIIEMIKRLYPEVGLIEDNAADALAVATCHSMQTQSKIQLSLK